VKIDENPMPGLGSSLWIQGIGDIGVNLFLASIILSQVFNKKKKNT
jgi:hypothetical protein